VTAGPPVVRRADGIELAVKVMPKAGRSAIEGVVLDAAGSAWLAVKVTAPADGDRANEAVMALLAKRLGVPASALRLVAGATARWKRVGVAGEPEALARAAEALAGRSD
jgi:uncharacterized protein YggU (UPF0235/DUF167 family)